MSAQKLCIGGVPNSKQQEFFASRAKYTAYGGARGGGKSWALRRKLVAMCLRYAGIHCLLLRRSLEELKANHIYPMLKEYGALLTWIERERAFVFANGSRIDAGYCDSDRDVLRYHPDLVVVNLGLNDIWGGENSATVYAQTLGKIFDTITAAGAEVIYMTPNTINYYRSGATEPHNMDVALITADFMTSGHFDGVIEAGRAEARKRNIPICDCTKKWKNFERAGVDTTLFLSGGINHPYPDMHWLFATTLIETLFDLNAD